MLWALDVEYYTFNAHFAVTEEYTFLNDSMKDVFPLTKDDKFSPNKKFTYRYIENNDSIWKMLMTFQEEVHAYDLQTACFLHCVLIVGKAKL